MKRNFECDSIVNILLRSKKAIAGRFRGIFYKYFNLFYKGSSNKLYFGWGARFINSKSIMLSQNVSFGVLSRIECHGSFEGNNNPKVNIGSGTSFGDYCHIGAINCIKIGVNVLGGSGVTIIDHNHGDPMSDLSQSVISNPKKRQLFSKGEIIIGDNVWIGDGVVILAGSEIGEGAVISANTVVACIVPPRSIYFGRNSS